MESARNVDYLESHYAFDPFNYYVKGYSYYDYKLCAVITLSP